MSIWPLLLLACSQESAFLADLRAKLPNPGVELFESRRDLLTFSCEPSLGSGTREGDSLRIVIKAAGKTQYSAQAITPRSAAPVKAGDLVLFAFQVRGEPGGSWGLYVQTPGPTYEGLANLWGGTAQGWTTHYLSFVSKEDRPAGGIEATFHLAVKPQTLEFGSFVALNLGQGVDRHKVPIEKVTYQGREPRAAWRAKAEKMILANRTAPIRITVTKGGRPCKGARVTINQVSHAYPFGTFLDRNPLLKDDDARRCREIIPKLFSRVTLPIYWADWGWDSEAERQGYMDRIAWTTKTGMRVKGHNLLWPSFAWSPTRLKALADKPQELRSTIVREAKERAEVLRTVPFENVDVLNEIRTNTDFAKLTGNSLYKEMFDIAKNAWPQANLVYNDYDIFEGGGANLAIRDDHKRLIRMLLADRAPLTMLGWQGHFSGEVTAPETVWKLLDEYAEFRLPIEITEFDLNTFDDQLQADYTRDLLTAWFAHPRTAGFTIWGFNEKFMYTPAGAMFRPDWSEKPNAKAWRDLVLGKWWTRATSATDAKGQAQARAFHGTQRVSISSGKATASVTVEVGPGGASVRVAL